MPYECADHLPARGVHSLSVLSTLPESTRVPSGENATAVTLSECGMLGTISILARSWPLACGPATKATRSDRPIARQCRLERADRMTAPQTRNIPTSLQGPLSFYQLAARRNAEGGSQVWGPRLRLAAIDPKADDSRNGPHDHEQLGFQLQRAASHRCVVGLTGALGREAHRRARPLAELPHARDRGTRPPGLR